MLNINNDVKSELLKSAFKSSINFPALSFIFDALEVNSKIKQRRAIEFIEDFAELLNLKDQLEIKRERITSESFADMLDQTIQRVVNNGSKKKLKLFKEVLAAHVLTEEEPALTEVYLKIIDRLTEKQILILDGLSKDTQPDYIHIHEQINDLEAEIKTMKDEDQREREIIDDLVPQPEREMIFTKKRQKIHLLQEQAANNHWRQAITYGCSEPEYRFLIQDLFNNGLVTDMGTSIGRAPFTVVEITHMGTDILIFLNNDA